MNGNTVEGLTDRIKDLRLDLASQLIASVEKEDAHFSTEHIAKYANTIAWFEGALQVAHLKARLEEKGASKEERLSALFREAVRTTDDTWSGRTNDVRRAFADGRREALDDLQWELS